MPSETLKQVLMSRDGLTPEEAAKEIHDMRKRISVGEDPEEILYDWGLEPDFVDELLF